MMRALSLFEIEYVDGGYYIPNWLVPFVKFLKDGGIKVLNSHVLCPGKIPTSNVWDVYYKGDHGNTVYAFHKYDDYMQCYYW